MPVKRIAQRRLVAFRAHLKLSADKEPIECVVRDISQTGARLILGSIPDLPETFSLLLSKDVTRNCRVIWRKDKQIGVSFVNRQMEKKQGCI
jgi:hypothetical protein